MYPGVTGVVGIGGDDGWLWGDPQPAVTTIREITSVKNNALFILVIIAEIGRGCQFGQGYSLNRSNLNSDHIRWVIVISVKPKRIEFYLLITSVGFSEAKWSWGISR